jgi:hypothetical protein
MVLDFRPDIAWPEEKHPHRSQQNRIVQLLKLEGLVLLFQKGASDSCSIHVPTHFGDSAGESTTSCTSSMKKGSSGINGFDLDKNNIIKPTFNTLTEEDRKALEAYHVEMDGLIYSRYDVMWQGLVLQDTVLIIIRKAKVTPEVPPNPSLSLNDVQSIINSALERQVKSSNELMCRLIEERDGEN